MDIGFSAAEQQFRAEVRDWLRANIPGTPRPLEAVDALDFDKAWQRTQYDGG